MRANALKPTTPTTCDQCRRVIPAGEEALGVALPGAGLVFCESCTPAWWGNEHEVLQALVASVRPDLVDGPPAKPTLEDLALAVELEKLAAGELEAEPVVDVEAEVLPFPEPADEDEVDGLRGAVGGGEL